MTTIHTLEADYGIYLSEAAIRKIMALNRRLHLAPQRPITIIEARDGHPTLFNFTMEGFSRTILAGSLTIQREAGVILHVYFQALLRWGIWEEVISDH